EAVGAPPPGFGGPAPKRRRSRRGPTSWFWGPSPKTAAKPDGGPTPAGPQDPALAFLMVSLAISVDSRGGGGGSRRRAGGGPAIVPRRGDEGHLHTRPMTGGDRGWPRLGCCRTLSLGRLRPHVHGAPYPRHR